MQFHAVQCMNPTHYESSETDTDLTHDICNGPITMEEIYIHLARLKNRKAPGSDSIPGEFLKYAQKEIVDSLYCVYNYIFDQSDWPSK